MQYIPDDGYYYLTLARNFSHYGFWTFDGSNVTSGFHLIWAYIIALIYCLKNLSDSQFVTAGIILGSTVAISTCIYICWRVYKDYSNKYILLWAAVLISSRTFIYNSISLTEWPLVILWAYIYFTYWHNAIANIAEARWNKKHSTIYLLAIVGILIRTDFIVLAVSLAVINLIFAGDKNNVYCAIAAVGGVISGLILVSIHNYIFTGSIIQSSVLMKAYWSKYPMGSEWEDSLSLLTSSIGFNNISLGLKQTVFLLFNIFPLVSIIAGWKEKKLVRDLICALVVVWVYLIFYYKTGSAQFWWGSNLFVPILFTYSLSVKILEEHYKLFARIIIIPLLLLIIFHNVLVQNQNDVSNPPWKRNRVMLQTGKYLKQHNIYGRIASWNSGIIGYYKGGSLINIDGLVNNSVYPYIIKNDLYDYMKKNDIKYIIDFHNMLTMKILRVRGGYDDPRFTTAPVIIFDYSGKWWSFLELMKVN